EMPSTATLSPVLACAARCGEALIAVYLGLQSRHALLSATVNRGRPAHEPAPPPALRRPLRRGGRRGLPAGTTPRPSSASTAAESRSTFRSGFHGRVELHAPGGCGSG